MVFPGSRAVEHEHNQACYTQTYLRYLVVNRIKRAYSEGLRVVMHKTFFHDPNLWVSGFL